jgi:hypothetical protein
VGSRLHWRSFVFADIRRESRCHARRRCCAPSVHRGDLKFSERFSTLFLAQASVPAARSIARCVFLCLLAASQANWSARARSLLCCVEGEDDEQAFFCARLRLVEHFHRNSHVLSSLFWIIVRRVRRMRQGVSTPRDSASFPLPSERSSATPLCMQAIVRCAPTVRMHDFQVPR